MKLWVARRTTGSQACAGRSFRIDVLGWSYLSSGRYASAEQTLEDVIVRFRIITLRTSILQ